MAFYYRGEEKEGDINITTLIDVVFILLIFFMISTTFIAIPGFKINLPKTAAPALKNPRKNITITVSKTGAIDVNGQQTSITRLKNIIKEQIAKSEITDPFVILQADKDTNHGFVVSVRDIIKQRGLTKIAIATEKQKIKDEIK